MSAPRGSCWWKLLTDSEIQQIEKELNPSSLSYGPPISWPEEVLTRSLKIAYNRQESRGAIAVTASPHPPPPPPSPLPNIQQAIEYLSGELNRILNRRIEELKTPQLAAWMRQGYYTYTHEEVWNPVAVVANNDCMMGKPSAAAAAAAAAIPSPPPPPPPLPRPPPPPVVATTTTTTTTRKTTAEVHMSGGSLFSRPPIRPPQRRDSSYWGGSDGSTLQFPSPSSGPSTANTSVGTRPTPVSTSPTTVESESSYSPKRLWGGGGGGGGGISGMGGGRGRGVTRTYRQGPELTGSCPQKRPRAALQCPHCSKTFPFPSKLKDHMHIHAETKGYPCGAEFCTKAFKRRRELQAHRKTHGEIPHEHHGHHGNHDLDDDEDEEMGDGSASPSPGDPEPPDSRAAAAATTTATATATALVAPAATRRTPSTPISRLLPPPPPSTTTTTTTSTTSTTTTNMANTTAEVLRDCKKSASPPDQAPTPSVTSLGGLLRNGGSLAAPRTPSLGRIPQAPTFTYQSSTSSIDGTRKVDFETPGMRTTLQTSPTLEGFVSQDEDMKSVKSDDSKRGGMTKAEEEGHMLELAAALVTGNGG